MQKLDNATVRLLSGTQVITSVHSVVKELVENSLDSASTNVEVNLENFGLDKLEVRDNGGGISKDEVPHIAKCHYTSKMRQISDLDTLETFGFRGEALSSLAAVANLSVMTATEGDDVGVVYTFDGAGNIISQSLTAASIGTSVTASNLFVNVPVRREFYKNSKQCRDELKKLEHLMIAFGLANHNVRFVLRHSRNVVWQKAAMSNLHSNMIAIFGSSLVQQMKWLQSRKDEHAELSGYFPACEANIIEITRSSADHMYVFVNKRLVDIKQINQVVRNAFKTAYPAHAKRYPIMCLFIKVPQKEVDVNLEPGKCTVLLHNLDAVLDQLAGLMDLLYVPKTSEVCQSINDSINQQTNGSENNAQPVEENLSQFSDNAVASPPTISIKQVFPENFSISSITDYEFHTSNKPTMANSASCSATSLPLESMPSQVEDGVTDLESADVENQITPVLPVSEETDTERAADTILVSAGDTNSGSSEERPFKMTTPGNSILHWSKGHCRDGHDMEPVRLLQRDCGSSPSHTVSLTKKPASALKLTHEGSSRSIKKGSQKMKLTNFFDKIGTSKSAVTTQVAQFCKDSVLSYWEEKRNFARRSDDKMSVIGPISNRHQWLVVVDQCINVFDVEKANQKVLYDRLLASFRLPASLLPMPIVINEHNVGGLDNMSLLKTLGSESTAANGNRFYNDPRLVANGFCLCQKIVHEEEVVELVSLHKLLSLKDLHETLILIKEQVSQKELHEVALNECRPLLVKQILQDEASRMSQVQLNTLQSADVLELLGYEQVDTACYHFVHNLKLRQ